MSADAEKRGRPDVDWERLERSAEDVALALGRWRRRAREAEDEVERLRLALENVAEVEGGAGDLAQEVRRLRAENATLSSRMLQARKRLSALMQRLSSLEGEP
jgi:chromosome segregation ATPase